MAYKTKSIVICNFNLIRIVNIFLFKFTSIVKILHWMSRSVPQTFDIILLGYPWSKRGTLVTLLQVLVHFAFCHKVTWLSIDNLVSWSVLPRFLFSGFVFDAFIEFFSWEVRRNTIFLMIQVPASFSDTRVLASLKKRIKITTLRWSLGYILQPPHCKTDLYKYYTVLSFHYDNVIF